MENKSAVVNVRVPGKPNELVEWNIIQNITDRWGEFNEYQKEKKPIELLKNDEALYSSLCSQMWSDDTFIVQKDGNFGVLFEFEVYTQESEVDTKDSNPSYYATLKPEEYVINTLVYALEPLVSAFPLVQFGVPDISEVENDNNRPVVWAFVPNGALNDFARHDLGKALIDILY